MTNDVLKAFNAELRVLNEKVHEYGSDLKQIKTGLELLNTIIGRLEKAINTLTVHGCARGCNPEPPTTPAIPKPRQLRSAKGG